MMQVVISNWQLYYEKIRKQTNKVYSLINHYCLKPLLHFKIIKAISIKFIVIKLISAIKIGIKVVD